MMMMMMMMISQAAAASVVPSRQASNTPHCYILHILCVRINSSDRSSDLRCIWQQMPN